MTVLCVSVRNQRTRFGLFDGPELVQHWGVSTDPRRTSDEWGLLVRGLTGHDDALPDVAGLCISSTVPVVLHELRVMTRAYFPAAHTVVVGPGVKTGLPVQMDNPREVGTDRVANAVAAADRWGGPSSSSISVRRSRSRCSTLPASTSGVRSRPASTSRWTRSGRGERSCVRSRSSGPAP